ncbi:hypothetical protein [Corynebacterium silvaticum]|uniref:Secreted protein n=1 Tax=Corynebacterium silvaticum TaxID=2320431 RepID=A0A7Y4P8J5_9CORY|nr:hypothetical protein [Corynebacterium silvaticum]ARU46932.1 hypothetical protein CBE74_11285 [Corynebacterium silvaticum]MBH5300673.1 hypothetical protein [Corynebacterium silvaticum]NOM64872.1 hypothetical protein [Corynebacterium silvaticum]NON70247.1 hypothetical protein [Corynebacterium silvaticum]TFA91707.1 hypothetical protein EU802_09655 [Corynebacterium silvaticum]
MKNNRILSLTISALATASVFTASSLAATSPLVTAVASAQTHDAMPGNYMMINKAEDGGEYVSELKSLVSVAKMRHLYHAASGEQKFENYVGASPEIRKAHEESENACYLAKARVSLAILKVEGNQQAREIDISQVGIDLAESKKALPLVKTMEEKYRILALNADAGTPNRAQINNTHKIANNGADGLQRVISKLESGEETYEYSAYSILDWNVQDRFIEKIKGEHHLGDEENQLTPSKVIDPKKIDKDEILKAALENKTKLVALNGTSPAPKPQEKPEKPKADTEKPAPEKPKTDAEKPKVDTENKTPETKDQVPPAKSPQKPQISWSPTTWPSWLKAIVSLGGVGLLAGLVHVLLPFLPR